LRAARVTIQEVQKMAQSDAAPLHSRALLELRDMLVARPHDHMLVITSQGRGKQQLVADLSPLTLEGHWPENQDATLDDDRATAATVVHQAPRFWTVATRKAYVQRFVRAAFEREMDRGDPLLRSLFEHDEAVDIVDGDRGDVVLFTRWGYAVRFSHRSIDVQGSAAMDLQEGDEVVAALSLPEESEILIATASGYVARRDTHQIPSRTKPRGTAGKRLIHARDVLSVYPYSPDDRILYLTYGGRLILGNTLDIPLTDRLGRGALLHDLGRDPAAAVTFIPKDLAP
jgi:DNA gyrase/topoisomerase IV subunit A